MLAPCALAVGGHGLAFENDLARCRWNETEDQLRGRGLAAARLADEPERLAWTDIERDAVDGLELGCRREPPARGLDLVGSAQLAHRDQRRARHANSKERRASGLAVWIKAQAAA